MTKSRAKVVALGLDLGGSFLKSGLVTPEGEVLHDDAVRSRTHEGPEGLRQAIAEAVARLQEKARWMGVEVRAAGLGLPGTIAGPAGTVLTAPPQIPGIRGFAAARVLRAASGVPSAADNDATLAGLAESRVGAGRGAPTFLLVTVGTGVGGGLVVGGQLIRGRYGTGGEIGHATFVPDGLPCPHGGRGCLELYASAGALQRFYGESGGAAGAEPREILRRAERGEARAARAFDRVGRNLGLGLAAAAAVIAPDVIAVGGGLAEAGRFLLDPLRAAFRAQSLPYAAKGCRIVRARLRNRAGLVGAGLLAFEEGL
jgi:glucokinase